MFWGLIMEPERRYTQTVKQSFHISMAALDVHNTDDEIIQVMCGYEGRNYLLCTLQNKKTVQVMLDLNFEKGSEIYFATNGKSHVHLTGYLNDDELDDYDEAGDEEEDEEVEQLETRAVAKQKRKAATNGAEPRKKMKTEMLLEQIDEEESDDSDVDFEALEEATDDEVVEDAESEEEEDSEDGEEDESDKEEIVKQNGVPNKKQDLKQKKQEKDKTAKSTPNDSKSEKNKSVKKTIEGGVVITDMKVGTGPLAKPGKSVQVYYEGRFKHNNKMFDSSTKGQGFKFRLGKQEVIKGWDVGIQGMQVGGKRRIICPPNMAYGAKGSPPVIPPNSTLVFEVELKKVN